MPKGTQKKGTSYYISTSNISYIKKRSKKEKRTPSNCLDKIIDGEREDDEEAETAKQKVTRS